MPESVGRQFFDDPRANGVKSSCVFSLTLTGVVKFFKYAYFCAARELVKSKLSTVTDRSILLSLPRRFHLPPNLMSNGFPFCIFSDRFPRRRFFPNRRE